MANVSVEMTHHTSFEGQPWFHCFDTVG